MEDTMRNYLGECKAQGKGKRRLLGLKQELSMLVRYLNDVGLDERAVRFKEALGYQIWLVRKGRDDGKSYMKRTVNMYMMEARSYFAWLKKRNLIITNPFIEVKPLRADRNLPKGILKESQMAALLAGLEDYEAGKDLWERIRGYRLHVVCELLYSTGMRIGEAAELRESDIDLVRGTVKVREGKNGKGRICFLNEYTKEVVYLYCSRMKEWLFKGEASDRLFHSESEWLKLSTNRLLKEKAAVLGLPPIACHGFRHAFASHILRAGCDIRYIQELLGHRSIDATQIYTRVEKEDLKRVLDLHHPRKWSKEWRTE
jgi:site-specific recombinase XerD